MKSSTSLKKAVALGSLFGLLLFPSLAEAAPVVVQTQANRSNASAGESGATISSSALISVVVTDAKGKPVSNLGSSFGSGNSAIGVPTGWVLRTDFNVPPGSCLMSSTQFYNAGNGVYTIRVVPFVGNPSCKWVSGEYHYLVQIDTASFNGSGLGVLTIP